MLVNWKRVLRTMTVMVIVVMTVLASSGVLYAADTTAPTTTHSFSGIEGNNGWYTSTVDVTLRASDLESGPSSTTYWLNSDLPTVVDHDSGQNQVVNPSFENGWFLSINNWDHDSGGSYWRSFIFSKFGWRSAAVADIYDGDDYYYWHNREDYIPAVAGDNYSASAWVKTLDIVGLGAWFEVWARDAAGNDMQITSSNQVQGSTDWTLLQANFIMPSGYEGVYLRLGIKDDGDAGIAFWDGVSLYGGLTALTDFTVVDNGNHILHYYSEDNDGNIETENTVSLKIDTVPPHDWNNFQYYPGANDHTYSTSLEVIDETSGVDVSTATYRWYTDHQDWGWSYGAGDPWESGETWDPVDSVTRVDNGQPATDGYTGEVKLTTPEIDFGNSATIMRVQFRIADMAGSSADSPVLTVEGAWYQGEGSLLYAKEGISMTAQPPTGQHSFSGVLISGGSSFGMRSEPGWEMENYSSTYDTYTALTDILPSYTSLLNEAVSLPGNDLPTASGVYKFDGDYTIDNNSTPSAFENSPLNAVVIVDGNLFIENGYTTNPTSAVLFVVTGDVGVAGNVNEMDGIFLCAGSFDTNYDRKHQQQLQLDGGVTALGGLVLGRDLGRKGDPSNDDTPAELFNLPYSYYFNEEFAMMIESLDGPEYDWRELGP